MVEQGIMKAKHRATDELPGTFNHMHWCVRRAKRTARQCYCSTTVALQNYSGTACATQVMMSL